jgi:methylated-DNA-protein-cysteine methyltransferase-like protein
MPGVYDEIYKIVRSIPKGRVLTYGAISAMIGGRMSAQGVGWALKALGTKKKAASVKTSSKTSAPCKSKVSASRDNSPDVDSVPWQRVVNAQGGTSTHKVGVPADLQRQILEAEGIVFNEDGCMDLGKYLWTAGMANYDVQTAPKTRTKKVSK